LEAVESQLIPSVPTVLPTPYHPHSFISVPYPSLLCPPHITPLAQVPECYALSGIETATRSDISASPQSRSYSDSKGQDEQPNTK